MGAGVLALPIALAGFGPIEPTSLLLVFGVLNVLTIAALVESITRDGRMRYGNAFLGRLIGDYLGRPGLAIAVPTVIILDAVGFSVALIGFGSTLAGVTGVSVVIWAGLLFAVVMAILWRGTLDATVAVAVARRDRSTSSCCCAISVIAFANARPDAFAAGRRHRDRVRRDLPRAHLRRGPRRLFRAHLGRAFRQGRPGRETRAAGTCWPGTSRRCCRRWSSTSIFVLVVTGAVGADALAGIRRARRSRRSRSVWGPIIDVLGTIYIVLGVGLSAIYVGLGLFNQMADLVASRARTARAASAGRRRTAGRLRDPGRPAGAHLRRRRGPAVAGLGLVHRDRSTSSGR